MLTWELWPVFYEYLKKSYKDIEMYANILSTIHHAVDLS